MIMTNFDKIALNLGWIIPYDNVGLYYKYIDNNNIKAVIDIGDYSRMNEVDTDYVKKYFRKTF